ncbi:hypothetical protein [Piscinibacter terrae]|uniref:Membrane domain of glycerophosphoryl diester phosphodiesterase n=1 Tax=Piscinibacter terrae TaxID=2496871 RepID=A0A3N7HQ62_9BURK|nr:hypothetical protein [Albitalea terrae]RQP24368.1 hypothetical protein DZC73_13810 [Albitalea terrae]
MAHRSPLDALNIVLSSVDAVRNLRALYVLLLTFSVAGLLTAMAENALAQGSMQVGALEAAAALFAAFYGGNAAGILVMDDARGAPVRDIVEALRASLFTAHRLILALVLMLAGYALFGAVLFGLLWLCRASVTGPVIGPMLFGAVVPLGVVGVGVALLSLVAVVVPLAAPAIWSGEPVLPAVRQLFLWVRQRLLTVALLMSAVSLLTGAVGALVTFAVMMGGRVIAVMGVTVVGVDVPAQQLMAGLFGYGLRSLGAAGAPTGSTGHAAAALVGGGMVFALALVLPGLVYLRGTCSVYLAMRNSSVN